MVLGKPFGMHRPHRTAGISKMFRSGWFLSLYTLALLGLSLAPLQAADWPGWRGPDRTGHSADPFPTRFPSDPSPLFELTSGPGYAAPVVSQDRLIWLSDVDAQETVHCHDLRTGKLVWTRSFAPAWGDEFEPGPRCTPLVDDDRVYVQSNQGIFVCLNLETGEPIWTFSFADYGVVWVPERGSGIGAATRRGHTGSAVIDGNRILVQVGSEKGASLVAFDKRSGKELWRSQDDLTAYTSPVVGTLAGRQQLVTATCEGLLGVAVEDGSLLWRVPFRTQANRNVLTPILHEDTVTFASFTTGMRRLKIQNASGNDGSQQAMELWKNRALGINLSTPVLVNGHLYGLGASKDYVCVELETGRVTWQERGFGEVASTLASGNQLIVLLDSGECRLLEATPNQYKELGRFQACGRTFSHPAYADGVLYVRDPRGIRAYKLVP
jgi:outer membrane protein assembly factor BamB